MIAQGTAARATLVRLLVACIAAVALGVVIASPGLLLTNDGPAHAFAGFARSHLDDPRLGFADLFVLGSPMTNLGAVTVFRVMEAVAGWRAAYVAMHVVAAELYALGALALALALGRGRFAAGLLAFPLALQSLLYTGVLSYLMGVGIVLIAVALWLRSPGPPPPKTCAAALLFVLAAAACHAVAACFGVLLLGAVTAFRVSWREPRSWAPELMRLCVVGAAAPLLAWRVRSVVAAPPVEPAYGDFVDRTLLVLRAFVPGPSWRVVAVSLLCIAGAASLAWRSRHTARSRGAAADRALLVAGVLLIVVTMSLPRDIGGWQLAGARALPFAVASLLALLDVDALPQRGRRAALAAMFAFAVLTFAWSAMAHRRLADAAAPALDGVAQLEAAQAGGAAAAPRRFVPIVLDARLGDAAIGRDHAPLFHLEQLAAIVAGGTPSSGHISDPDLHAVVEKQRTELPAVDYWEAISSRSGDQRDDALRRHLAWIHEQGGLFLYGRPRDLATARVAGYLDDPPIHSDRVLFARFVGCDGVARVEGLSSAARIAVGWWPLRQPDRTFDVEPAAGVAQVVLPAFGCGEVWMTVDDDADGDGTREVKRCRGVGVPPVRAMFSAASDNRLVCVVEQ